MDQQQLWITKIAFDKLNVMIFSGVVTNCGAKSWFGCHILEKEMCMKALAKNNALNGCELDC
jgi:hypothetical protein